jgi:hypothetical protein
LLIGFFFIICVPLVNVATPQPLWRKIVLPLLALAGICMGIGVVQSHPSAQHPHRDNLLYAVNSDDHTARWVSTDAGLDAYTAQFIPGGVLKRQPIPNFLAGLQRPVLSSPAPVIALSAPIAEIQTNEQQGDLHVSMNVKSQREASRMVLKFEPDAKLLSVKVSGNTVPLGPNGAGTLALYGIDSKGVNIEFTTSTHSGVSFWLADYSVGLPTTQRRSPNLIANQTSDETVVCRHYTVGSQGK